MKRIKQLLKLILVSTICLISSCNKKELLNNATIPIKETDNILNSNSQILDTLVIKNISNGTITIDKSKLKSTIKPGDIIVSPPSSLTEAGLLVKVLSISENSNQIICTTEPAALNDAFKQLNINYTQSDTFSIISDGINKSDGTVTIKLNKNITSDIKMTGTIMLNIPSVKIEYLKKSNSIEPEKILFQVELNTYGSNITFTNTNSKLLSIDKVTLKQVILPDIRFLVPFITPVGVIPIPMLFGQVVNLDILPLKILGAASFTTSPKIKVVMGLKYENGVWFSIDERTVDASSMKLFKKDFTPNLNVTADLILFNPQYEIHPYKIENLKGKLSIPNSLNLKVQNQTPNYTLMYNMGFEASAEGKFWGVKKVSLSKGIIEKKILEGDFPYEIGDTAFGGIVTGLDSSGLHGFVTSKFDISDGVNPDGTADWSTANQLCRNWTVNGYSNWTLPTQSQLYQIYIHRNKIGNFLTACNDFHICTYWSSTPTPDQKFISALYFTNGTFWSNYVPTAQARVRPVRLF